MAQANTQENPIESEAIAMWHHVYTRVLADRSSRGGSSWKDVDAAARLANEAVAAMKGDR